MTNIDEHRKEFEELIIYSSMLLSSKIMILNKMKASTDDVHILSNIELERDLLIMWSNIFWIFERINEKRFLPEKKEYLKKIENEINNFIDKHRQDSSYYQDRFNLSKNPSDRLRYSFICWFLNKDPKFLLMTIETAFDIITNSLNKNGKESTDYILPCDLLSYSYTLFSLYIPTNSNVKKLIRDKAIEIIIDVRQNNFSRWLIEPSEIVCNVLDSNAHDLASQLISNLHEGAHKLSILEDIAIDDRIGNCFIERSLIDRSIQFVRFLNLSGKEKEECRKQFHSMIAKSFEREATLRISKNDPALILANHCYLPAAKEYKIAGDQTNYNFNFLSYQQNNYFPPEAYTEYHLTIHNPNVIEGDDEDTLIDSLSKNDLIIPDKETIRKQVEDDVLKNPILLSIPHEKLSKHGHASKTATGEEEIMDHLVYEKMISHIQFYENVISQNLLNLENENKITADAFVRFMSKFSLLDDNTIELIRRGISHHFNQDYVASIHILIPQLENVLRIILNASNINILKEENEVIMNKQFRRILEMPEVSEIIGSDFDNYLMIKYAGLKGINLRNDVSHGFLTIADFNHSNSCAIVYGLLKLLHRYEANKNKSV